VLCCAGHELAGPPGCAESVRACVLAAAAAATLMSLSAADYVAGPCLTAVFAARFSVVAEQVVCSCLCLWAGTSG
jgi:hypothetical protein